jgi:DNA-binding FadR family transcriptional regulator
VRFEALLEAREAIEPAAARLAALHRSDADLAEMTRVHREFESANNAAAHTHLNLEWHRAVMRASGNELMIAFFNAIADAVVSVSESHSLFSPDVHREVARVHGRVLQAIADRDPEAAFRRMLGHVGTYSTLVKQLDKNMASNTNGSGRKAPARRKR